MQVLPLQLFRIIQGFFPGRHEEHAEVDGDHRKNEKQAVKVKNYILSCLRGGSQQYFLEYIICEVYDGQRKYNTDGKLEIKPSGQVCCPWEPSGQQAINKPVARPQNENYQDDPEDGNVNKQICFKAEYTVECINDHQKGCRGDQYDYSFLDCDTG